MLLLGALISRRCGRWKIAAAAAMCYCGVAMSDAIETANLPEVIEALNARIVAIRDSL